MMLMRSAKICNLQIPLLLRFSISIEVWQSNPAMHSKNEQGTALHNPLCARVSSVSQSSRTLAAMGVRGAAPHHPHLHPHPHHQMRQTICIRAVTAESITTSELAATARSETSTLCR